MKRILRLVLSALPSTLPAKDDEFDVWADDILDMCGLPLDNDSLKQALATQVMHLPATLFLKPKLYFVLSIKKAIANQVAYNKIDEIRKRAKAANDAQTIANVTEKVV